MKSEYTPSILEESDIRSVIRLLGEVAVLKIDLAQKKQRLLSGMCALIDGDGWAWSLTGASATQSGAVTLNALSGGRSDALPAVLALPDVAEGNLERGELSAIDQGRAISARQIADDKLSSIHFGRLKGRAPFSPREEMMARIFCEEVAWLHDPPRQRMPAKLRLSPRQMATLTLLTEGLSHKEIAARLKLSPNTVNGYVKEIYRHFGTHSHAELLKRYPLAGRHT